MTWALLSGCGGPTAPVPPTALTIAPPTDALTATFPRPVEAWSVDEGNDGNVAMFYVALGSQCVPRFDDQVVATLAAEGIVGHDARSGTRVWSHMSPDACIGRSAGGHLFVTEGATGSQFNRGYCNWLGYPGTNATILDHGTGEQLATSAGFWSFVTDEIAVLCPDVYDQLAHSDCETQDTAGLTFSAPLGWEFSGGFAYAGAGHTVLDSGGEWVDLLAGEFGSLAGMEPNGCSSPNGVVSHAPQRAVTCADSGWVSLWDADAKTATYLATVDDLYPTPEASLAVGQSPALDDLDVYLATGPDQDGEIQACDLDRVTGGIRWCADLPLGGELVRGLAFAVDGDRVLVWADIAYDAYGLDPSVVIIALGTGQGEILWRWEQLTGVASMMNVPCIPEAMGTDGYVYVAEDARLVAIDPMQTEPMDP